MSAEEPIEIGTGIFQQSNGKWCAFARIADVAEEDMAKALATQLQTILDLARTHPKTEDLL